MTIRYIQFILLLCTALSFGQQVKTDSLNVITKKSPKLSQFILPTALIGYGVIAISNDGLQQIDRDLNEALVPSDGNILVHSDYLQYSPVVSVYALNFFKVKGKNNFKDRTILLGASTILTAATVNILKKQRIVIRPNGKNAFSFPSGHTAVAFMGAEFLHQEYKDRSIWYGVAGYTVAAATGAIRLYNNAHWFSDIVAGAGIGILSTKLMYYVYPYVQRIFKRKSQKTLDIAVVPHFSTHNFGLSVSIKL